MKRLRNAQLVFVCAAYMIRGRGGKLVYIFCVFVHCKVLVYISAYELF